MTIRSRVETLLASRRKVVELGEDKNEPLNAKHSKHSHIQRTPDRVLLSSERTQQTHNKPTGGVGEGDPTRKTQRGERVSPVRVEGDVGLVVRVHFGHHQKALSVSCVNSLSFHEGVFDTS